MSKDIDDVMSSGEIRVLDSPDSANYHRRRGRPAGKNRAPLSVSSNADILATAIRVLQSAEHRQPSDEIMELRRTNAIN
ncbi:unnamed protein product [Leptidea sinapis]|uniref:Uncharacterized protein n=1 Tax=Leptidea sinapis TaxID=189913 RepID=A0A5E4QU69_9NEOP|nr:unnamed protein product [Leptidea sinapis]